MCDEKPDTALLRNEGRMIFFSFGGKDIRFLGPKCLRRFTDVKKWHDGYIEVMADYGERVEEDYIDLMAQFQVHGGGKNSEGSSSVSLSQHLGLDNLDAAAAADEVRLVLIAALDDDPVGAALEQTFQRAVGVGEA